MKLFRRAAPGADANEVATQALMHREGLATTVVSAIALLFSGFSLWESSLKQADLSVYITDTVSYARDVSGGYDVRQAGGYEVLAVPVTIANGGARDGAVLSLQIEAKHPETGQTVRFDASYTADATYFAAVDNPTTGAKRPKLPFAPLVITGRSVWSGTILFYVPDYNEKKLLTSKGKIEATLKVVTPRPTGWLDRLLGGGSAQPITLTFDVPEISTTYLMAGEFARLRSATAKP
ncbi:MAG TPA: hypothetical protein VH858_17710 [Hyphomicrobiales bacterium]|jgi:hypothetical protein